MYAYPPRTREPQREGANDALAPRIAGEPPDRGPDPPTSSAGQGPRTRAPAATIGAVTEKVGDTVGAEIVVSTMKELGGDHRRRE